MTVQKTKTLVGGLLLVLCTVLLPAAFLTVGAAALRPLLRECRQLQRLTAHYYDRSYCRDQRYRI